MLDMFFTGKRVNTSRAVTDQAEKTLGVVRQGTLHWDYPRHCLSAFILHLRNIRKFLFLSPIEMICLLHPGRIHVLNSI